MVGEEVKHIGFTGTRHGMTEEQKDAVWRLCHDHYADIAHHGDCIGADAEFHFLADSASMRIVGHPPIDDTHRYHHNFDETRAPKSYLARNADIVAESDVMIACPFEPTEQPRGGTWATIRMARKAGKPLALVLPDGTVSYERWPS